MMLCVTVGCPPVDGYDDDVYPVLVVTCPNRLVVMMLSV